jgi:DNA-binding CsgD family transcriptional regulator
MMLMVRELTEDTLLGAVRAGVHGYVRKESPDWVFSTAVRSVADGEPFLAGPARELEVVRGIGIGLSNREIARRLRVAETTVKSCTSSILAKLDVRNRVEVALTACRVGLVPLHPRPWSPLSRRPRCRRSPAVGDELFRRREQQRTRRRNPEFVSARLPAGSSFGLAAERPGCSGGRPRTHRHGPPIVIGFYLAAKSSTADLSHSRNSGRLAATTRGGPNRPS